jgi:type III secretion protein V
LTLRADARVPVRGWEVRLRGLPLQGGTLPDGRLLAESAPAALPAGVEGEPATHPISQALASFIPTSSAETVRAAGIRVIDGPECLSLALDTALRTAASDLVGVDETQRLVDAAQARHPALVRELVPRRIDAPTLAEVLRRLVAEDVPLGDLRDVLEAVVASLPRDGAIDTARLAEQVRTKLARRISHRLAPEGRVAALALDSATEDLLRGALVPAGLALEPDFADSLLASLKRERESNPRAVLLVAPDLRRPLRQLVEADHPRLPVVSYAELLPSIEVERSGTVRIS